MSQFWNAQHIVVLVIVSIILLFVAATIDVLNNNYRLQQQADNAELDNQVTELENQNLKLEQTYYQTEEYMDLSARSLLGKAQPGENLVILPRAQHDNSGSADGSAKVSKSNLDQWLDFLFGQHN